MAKPTFVLVPGAWHTPAHFDYVRRELANVGYKVVAVDLPGHTSSPRSNGKLIGIEEDVTETRQVILSRLEAGEDVVVVSHSYGSIPATASTCGLSKAERGTNGVIASVIMAGFILEKGTTMLQVMGGQLPPQYWLENEVTLPFNGPGAIHVLYNDVEHNEALKAVWKLIPQSYGINISVVPDQLAGLQGIPLWYLMTTKDNACPSAWQHASVEAFQKAGLAVTVGVAPTGHSPFLNMPAETAKFLRKAAGEDIESGFAQK